MNRTVFSLPAQESLSHRQRPCHLAHGQRTSPVVTAAGRVDRAAGSAARRGAVIGDDGAGSAMKALTSVLPEIRRCGWRPPASISCLTCAQRRGAAC